MVPVHWTIDEVLLVAGDGDPYCFELLGRGPLPPPAPDPADKQLSLFP
jgi:hypothetical protein